MPSQAPAANTLWTEIIDTLQPQLPAHAFRTWLEPIRPSSIDDDVLHLTVPSRFFREWIEENYLKTLNATLRALTGLHHHIELQVDDRLPAERPTDPQLPSQTPSPPATQPEKRPATATALNPRYTFEQFIVGRANQFAQAAARAVAESPAQTYNPLFIYGGSGLGKTHIMQAVGNHLLRSRPDFQVFYVSAETFMNEMISSIQENDRIAFRRKYRGMDILLIDDVHFLEGKEATQEEFFHTFNTLYGSHKQIVLTSDRPPKELHTLEERLISRFEWGLVTDIQVPDLETRIAILRKKALADGIDVDPEVTEYIARHIKSNIRELEGSLIRLLAYASITSEEITLALAQHVLRDNLIRQSRPLTVSEIQKKVAQEFSLSLNDMLSPKRTKAIALPRQVAMYLARELTSASLIDLGRQFGGRDHTTVLHSFDKIRSLIETDHELGATVRKLRNSLDPT
ncbi:MAG: chromosomal replication initiator protein DnaA [Gemmatimonadetes bacterium]|nr:chromosomal replication initiator protein DnaA [Gemmatimonadota bacterium]